MELRQNKSRIGERHDIPPLVLRGSEPSTNKGHQLNKQQRELDSYQSDVLNDDVCTLIIAHLYSSREWKLELLKTDEVQHLIHK